jgi:hypothetical protein
MAGVEPESAVRRAHAGSTSASRMPLARASVSLAQRACGPCEYRPPVRVSLRILRGSVIGSPLAVKAVSVQLVPPGGRPVGRALEATRRIPD